MRNAGLEFISNIKSTHAEKSNEMRSIVTCFICRL